MTNLFSRLYTIVYVKIIIVNVIHLYVYILNAIATEGIFIDFKTADKLFPIEEWTPLLIYAIHYEIQDVFPINLPVLNFHRTISFKLGGKHWVGNRRNTILCYCPWVISAKMKLINLREIFQISLI